MQSNPEPDLHAAIMNLPCKAHAMYEAGEQLAARVVYSFGHRDARHAAAELAGNAVATLESENAKLREALTGLFVTAQEVISHMDGRMPLKGWLRDNAVSRLALASLIDSAEIARASLKGTK